MKIGTGLHYVEGLPGVSIMAITCPAGMPLLNKAPAQPGKGLK